MKVISLLALAPAVYSQGWWGWNNRRPSSPVGRQVNTDCSSSGNGEGCWLQWSGWSSCKGVCGQGMKIANRKCKDGIPGIGGCFGSENRRQPCADSSLVLEDQSCPYWSFWSEWSSCNVAPSTDPCIRNNRGTSSRARVCNDPTTTTGGSNACQGTAAETQECWSDLPTIKAFDGPEYTIGDYTACMPLPGQETFNHCGHGRQTARQTHVCANVPGTWVPETRWYKELERACCNPCCQQSEWSQWQGTENRCTSYKVYRTRKNIDICGGCAAQGITAENETEEDIRYPIDIPVCNFVNEVDGWSGCIAQNSPWRPGVITTCGMNGLQTRRCTHVCENYCNNQALVASDSRVAANCAASGTWRSREESRSCGPEQQQRLIVTCPNECTPPECYSEVYCEHQSESYLRQKIECPMNEPEVQQAPCPIRAECTPSAPPQPCNCDDEYKYQNYYSKCADCAPDKIPCPAKQESSISRGWQQSEALRALAINSRFSQACICRNDERYYEFEQYQYQLTAENGDVCHVELQQGAIRAIGEEVCPGAIQWQPCTRTCDMPGQESELQYGFRIDLCGGPEIPVDSRSCPPKPNCCKWEPWQEEGTCPQQLCPSEGQNNRYRVRYNTCDTIEPERLTIPCPQAPCPAWEEYGVWSQCSAIRGSGIICGGFRFRERGYPCMQDAVSGICKPFKSTYGNTGENDISPFRQIDAFSENHHSWFCWNEYQNYVRSLKWSDWSQGVIDGCDNGRRRIKFSRTKLDECTGEVQEDFKFEYEQPQPCIDTPVDTNVDGTAVNCIYDANRCSANVQFDCVAASECGSDLVRVRPATLAECPVDNSPVEIRRSGCSPRGDNGCVGQCAVTYQNRCERTQTEIPEQCYLPPRWGRWSSWGPVPTDGYTVNVYLGTLECPACGGVLTRSRQMECVQNGEPQLETEEHNCPAPQWGWSDWGPCSQTCSGRNMPPTGVKSRFLRTHDYAQHCTPPVNNVEEATCGAQPCPCVPQETVDTFCMHPRDNQASCGKGVVHTRVTTRTFDPVTGVECDSWDQVRPYNADDQVEDCDLPYQPTWVSGTWSGCGECGGGLEYLESRLVCEGRFPFNLAPQPNTRQESRACAAPIQPAATTQWVGECERECATEAFVTRQCMNGVFQAGGCSCGRCCIPESGTTISMDGMTETKRVPCQPLIPTQMVELPGTDGCQCGSCTKQLCQQNLCTNEIVQQTCRVVPDPKPVNAVPPSEWSECKYEGEVSSTYDGYTNMICDKPGFRERMIYETCRDGLIVDNVTVERMEDRTCYLPSTVVVEATDCIRVDACSPHYHTKKFRRCGENNILISSDKITTDPQCRATEETYWTEWTMCSVECGDNGAQTRQLIRKCDNAILDTEDRPCGCPIARWTEWSGFVGVCDPCGPEQQQKTQTRTCMKPRFGSEPQYGYKMPNTNGCDYSRCNMCQPDQDGATTQRVAVFSRDVECPAEVSVIEDPRGRTCEEVNTDGCSDFTLHRRIMQCGKQIHTEDAFCAAADDVYEVPKTIQGTCMCDMGKGYDETCRCGDGYAEVTDVYRCGRVEKRVVPCYGDLGQKVSKVSDWDRCSKECNGGKQTKITKVVCEKLDTNGQEIVIRGQVETKDCALHPCAYWGSWSEWGVCSSTCGKGTQTKIKKCEGGPEGTGLCTGSSTTFQECDMGECCLYEWSSWSDCCKQGDQMKKLRWRGNKCSGGKWEKLEEDCTNDVYNVNNIQTCEVLNGVKLEATYGTGSFFLENNNLPQYSYNRKFMTGQVISKETMNFGRIWQDRDFSLNGTDYSYRVLGSTGSWYQGSVEIDVQEYNHNSAYYYNIEGVWYKYSNGQLNLSENPMWYSPSYKPAPTYAAKPVVQTQAYSISQPQYGYKQPVSTSAAASSTVSYHPISYVYKPVTETVAPSYSAATSAPATAHKQWNQSNFFSNTKLNRVHN